jgi:hypothetical protein
MMHANWPCSGWLALCLLIAPREGPYALHSRDSLSRSLVSHPRIYSCTGTVVRHSSLWTDTMLMLYLVLVATFKVLTSGRTSASATSAP